MALIISSLILEVVWALPAKPLTFYHNQPLQTCTPLQLVHPQIRLPFKLTDRKFFSLVQQSSSYKEETNTHSLLMQLLDVCHLQLPCLAWAWAESPTSRSAQVSGSMLPQMSFSQNSTHNQYLCTSTTLEATEEINLVPHQLRSNFPCCNLHPFLPSIQAVSVRIHLQLSQSLETTLEIIQSCYSLIPIQYNTTSLIRLAEMGHTQSILSLLPIPFQDNGHFQSPMDNVWQPKPSSLEAISTLLIHQLFSKVGINLQLIPDSHFCGFVDAFFY